jgi:hypothetical protein
MANEGGEKEGLAKEEEKRIMGQKGKMEQQQLGPNMGGGKENGRKNWAKGEIDNFIKSNGAPGEIMVVASRRMGTNGWLVAADILPFLPADDAASCLLGYGGWAILSPCLQAFAPTPI